MALMTSNIVCAVNVSGGSASTRQHTLTRKRAVVSGTPSWPLSRCGTTKEMTCR